MNVCRGIFQEFYNIQEESCIYFQGFGSEPYNEFLIVLCGVSYF